MNYLTPEDVQKICYEYAKARLSYDEPLPSFESRYPNILESVLYAPQRSVAGKDMYPSLAQKASVLFYEVVKQHPFVNGNKRMACVTMMVFLFFNDKWFEVNWKKLYDLAVSVAESRPDQREVVVKTIAEVLNDNLINIPYEK